MSTEALRPPPQEAGEGAELISFAAFLPCQEQENVLQRVLQLPVVSGTCECFQKTYASTKEAHPLVVFTMGFPGGSMVKHLPANAC